MMKCCGTCSRMSEIDIDSKCLCLLTDDLVDFVEYCNSWSNESE